MPISDEEFDEPKMMQEPSSQISKAELRKSHKPIMEKRRRARINNCLNEIKNLILEAMNKDPARHTKLEKADILEMAVKHLQNVQRQQLAIAIASDPSVIRKFRNGFNDCAAEIDKFICKSENNDDATSNNNNNNNNGIRDRVQNHLQKCISGLEQVAQFSLPAGIANNVPSSLSSASFNLTGSGIFTSSNNLNDENNTGNSGITTSEGDQNNNPRIQIPQGIQLIPSRLPTGELALLVPNSSNLSYFSTPHQRPSAFVSVNAHQKEPPSKILINSPPSSPSTKDVISRESPKGFRPLHRPKPSYPLSAVSTCDADHQVPQISSSTMEVKTMKFPIHKSLLEIKDRKSYVVENNNATSVIKKLSEPLCIITNQNERYKHAPPPKDDSIYLEENRGIKRNFSDIFHHHHHHPDGNEFFLRPSKTVKLANHSNIPPTSSIINFNPPQIKDTIENESLLLSSEMQREQYNNDKSSSSENRNEDDNNINEKAEQTDNMWRPW